MPAMPDRDDPPEGEGRGVSRRDLLKGGAAAGTLGTLGLFDAAGAEGAGKKGRKNRGKGGGAPEGRKNEDQAPSLPEICGPGPVKIRLRVNGEFEELAVEPRTTLLEVLRDRLGHYGAKEVCDRGSCGACTVLLDGDPTYSCCTLALSAHRRQVMTVEALAQPRRGGDVHPLAAAFAAAGAVRCGYCTPGFLMAAKGLLDRNPDPRPADVDQALCGNQCRCGCYPSIRQAVLDAAPQVAGTEDDEAPAGEEESKPEETPPPEENLEDASAAAKHLAHRAAMARRKKKRS